MTNDIRASVVTVFESSPFLEDVHARTVRAISAITSPCTITRAEYGAPEADEHAGTAASDAAVIRR